MAPNYDPTQLNNQGVGTVLRGDEARRERYNNYNVTLRRQLPANFSATVAYIGAYGTRDSCPDFDTARDQPHPVRGDRAVWRPAVQPAVEPAAARYPAPVSWIHRHGAAGAATVSAVHEHPYQNTYKGKTRYDSLQTTLERHFRDDFALLVAYTLSKTEDNVLKQDGSGDEWAYAAGRHYPALLQAHVDLRGADRSRQGDRRRWRARTDRRWLDDDGHPQLPQRRHAERLGRPDQRRRLSRSVPTSWRRGSGHLRRIGGRSRERHAVPEPGRVRNAAVVGAGHSEPRSERHLPILDVRGPALYHRGSRVPQALRASATGVPISEWTSSTLFNRSGLGGPNTDVSSPNFGRIFAVGIRGAAHCSCRSGRPSRSCHSGGLRPPDSITVNSQLPRLRARGSPRYGEASPELVGGVTIRRAAAGNFQLPNWSRSNHLGETPAPGHIAATFTRFSRAIRFGSWSWMLE